MDIWTLLGFGLILLCTFGIEAATGFGSSILALPFLTMLVDVKTVVPVLPMINYCLTIFIIVTSYKDILWKEYLRMVVLLGIGMPFGLWAVGALNETILKFCLGLFMIFVAVKGFVKIYRDAKYPDQAQKDEKPSLLKNILLIVMMLIGGVIHGAFTTSGPFVVTYATQRIKRKENFRATLAMLWITLNTIVVATNFASGRVTGDVWKLILISIPFLFVGIWIGNRAYKKMNPALFTKVIYLVMMVAGVFMAVQQAIHLF